MKWNRRRLAFLVVCGLVVALFWAYRQRPAVSFHAGSIQSIDVEIKVWDDPKIPASTQIKGPQAIAKLVAVFRSGAETQDHKFGSRGKITLHRSAKQNLNIEFLPGHYPEWYEFRYEGTVYRVPRQDFVNAMNEMGIDVPLECR